MLLSATSELPTGKSYPGERCCPDTRDEKQGNNGTRRRKDF